MNVFGISITTSAPQVFASPPEAPPRPGEWKCFNVFHLFAFETFVTLIPGYYSLATLGILGMIAVLIFKPLQRRHYDRTGWYQKHEVVLPPLPFEIRESEKIVFDSEGVHFFDPKSYWLGLLTFGFEPRPKRTVAYSQISEVRTECFYTDLQNVALRFASSPCADTSDLEYLPAGWNGETVRSVLALLRVHAPHATFSGPQWVEEGWVPRTGFSSPQRAGGGA